MGHAELLCKQKRSYFTQMKKTKHPKLKYRAAKAQIQGGLKKPLPNDQKIVLNRIKGCQ